jgi:hypothetical protein
MREAKTYLNRSLNAFGERRNGFRVGPSIIWLS